VLNWSAVTLNTDGSPAGLVYYLIEAGPSATSLSLAGVTRDLIFSLSVYPDNYGYFSVKAASLRGVSAAAIV
jgi:hypothetical protein